MTTITSGAFPLGGIISAPRRLWLAACGEVKDCALAMLLAVPSSVDPDEEFHR